MLLREINLECSRSVHARWILNMSLTCRIRPDFHARVWLGNERVRWTRGRSRNDYALWIWAVLDWLDKSAEDRWRVSISLPSRVSDMMDSVIDVHPPRSRIWTLLSAFWDLCMNQNVMVPNIWNIVAWSSSLTIDVYRQGPSNPVSAAGTSLHTRQFGTAIAIATQDFTFSSPGGGLPGAFPIIGAQFRYVFFPAMPFWRRLYGYDGHAF